VYFDSKPCQVCGSEVRLRAQGESTRLREPDPDGTVDERVCTNPECATNTQTGPAAPLP
jgi:hypothetical protein